MGRRVEESKNCVCTYVIDRDKDRDRAPWCGKKRKKKRNRKTTDKTCEEKVQGWWCSSILVVAFLFSVGVLLLVLFTRDEININKILFFLFMLPLRYSPLSAGM